jgi:hypothetical protein
VIRVGEMQLSQPEVGDPLPLWAHGLIADGGYWKDIRRLADHDHSGGTNGAPVAGAGSGVSSVNGETGEVVLTAADVGAPTQAQHDALVSRVATLEAQLATLLVHVHSHGTFGATTAPEAP